MTLDLSARRLVPLLVAAIALPLLVWQAWVFIDNRREDSRRHEALAVARSQIEDLTTMDAKTAKETIKRMSGRLSGDFERQFNAFSAAFAKGIAEGKISSRGSVRAAALSSYDDTKASALVATSAEVTVGKQKPVERHWRLKVDLAHGKDAWQITGMEFVQ